MGPLSGEKISISVILSKMSYCAEVEVNRTKNKIFPGTIETVEQNFMSIGR